MKRTPGMPNPTEIATIVAGGKVYSHWQSVEVERIYGQAVSHFRFVTAEPGPTGDGWGELQLMPGIPAQVYLAGQLALTGVVQIRQAAYDAVSHSVEIIVASYTGGLPASSVDGAPGQYLNSTLQQIAPAVCGPVGVAVKFVGNAPGANKPFERVSEHIGETRFAFLERLARMRDLHICDDETGALVFARGAADGPGATLVEGKNILKARMLLDQQWTVKEITAILQQFGNDRHWGDDARDISATVDNAAATNNWTMKFLGQEQGDAQDAQMLATHEKSLNDLTTCEAVITVQGWLMDDGSLWINNLRKSVTIDSPMLVPVNPFNLLLRGVKHMQSNENGSTTELTLCIPNGLGDDRQITSITGLV
jgi:prophage tail gpP-like protein